MKENFSLLLNRVLDTNEISDLEYIRSTLCNIGKNVICVGSGGSNVVSEYASKIFHYKNNCISLNLEPRDLKYINIDIFDNIFICSYSGNNYGVKVSLSNDKEKYLFTNQSNSSKQYNVIQYKSNLSKEKSFISLAATLMPMSVLLNYYLEANNFIDLMKRILSDTQEFSFDDCDNFEIISGIDTSVASNFLESTLVEAGLANPIIHSKYNYCHGRTTLSNNRSSVLIYLCNEMKEIDKLILVEAQNLYKDIVILKSDYNDLIIDNFNLTVKAMHLTKYIACLKKKDLSKVKYSSAVKRLYHFKGDM